MTKRTAETHIDGNPLVIADEFLQGMAVLRAGIKKLEDKAAAEQKKIIDKYAAEIAPLADLADGIEKKLLDLMKAHKGLIWGSEATNLKLNPAPHSEIAYLENGELRYEVSTPVALPRKHDAIIAALETLGAGYAEAVKVKKSLDKDQVNAWADDKLTTAGLKRKGPEETFDYTLKGE